MTSSIKPEEHNVSQCCQRRTEPQPQWICIKNLAKIGRAVPEICSLTDRHIDRQKDKLITVLRSLTGRNNECKCNSGDFHVMQQVMFMFYRMCYTFMVYPITTTQCFPELLIRLDRIIYIESTSTSTESSVSSAVQHFHNDNCGSHLQW